MLALTRRQQIHLPTSWRERTRILAANPKQDQFRDITEVKANTAPIRSTILAHLVPDDVGLVIEAPRLHDRETFGQQRVEIEWNNKDPFFDRDLENFKRLHADGGISLGIIITRGASLQDSIGTLVRRFADDKNINSHDDMDRIGLNPTRRQIRDVMKRVTRNKNPIPFRDAWTDQFVSDKFGTATTHWSKLQERVQRGVGNPCPLVLIGLPSSIVSFGEDQTEVQKLLDNDDD